MTKRPIFAVVGAGHGGLAMAGHLGLMGFEVRLLNRSAERLEAVREFGGIHLEGDVSGFGAVACATATPGEAVEGADVVMVALPATAHRWAAEVCAPHLHDGQIVILNPGRTFGALEFRQVLRLNDCRADVTVAECQTFLYASRVTGPGKARIFRVKNHLPLASLHAHRIPRVLESVRTAYPQFVPGDNVLKTSFNNIGSVFHPALMVLNSGWIDDPADFEFYYQGVSPKTALVLEAIDAERVAVAAALGIRAMSARQWLYFAYDAAGKDLFESIHANPGYRGILAPHRLAMRYLTEDVPCGLVPMASAGRKFGVATPTMDAVVRLASALIGTDFAVVGRTVESIGIANLDLRQLRRLAIGEDA
jgi:opine dehydrogenase